MKRNRGKADVSLPDASIAETDGNYLISVQVAPQYSSVVDAARLRDLAAHTLCAEGRKDLLELGITVTSDQEIHALNKHYLQHDYPTDVLSFGGGEKRPGPEPGQADEDDTPGRVAATEYVTEGYEGDTEESGASEPATDTADPASRDGVPVAFVTPPGWPVYLGDVVISYETAELQAADYNHSPAAEVDVLLVHGLLHLLGYDDHAQLDREKMHARQDVILAAFRR